MRQFLFCLSLACLLLSACEKKTNQTITNFNLLDQNGQAFELFRSSAKFVALVSYDQQCFKDQKWLVELQMLGQKFHKKDLKLALITTRKHSQFAAKTKIPLLFDDSQNILKSAQIKKFGEILILESSSGKLISKGTLNSSTKLNELYKFLTESIEGRPSSIQAVSDSLCDIEYDPSKNISYAKQIAPLIQEKCSACHYKNDLAPNFNSHKKIKQWSAMIKETIHTARMPPWHPDPSIGRFKNDISLSTEEKKLLLTWIDQGSPMGGDADPLVRGLASNETWRLGKPDLILRLKQKEIIPAEGRIDYRYSEMEPSIPGDRWLRAIEYKISNETVVHHNSLIPSLLNFKQFKKSMVLQGGIMLRPMQEKFRSQNMRALHWHPGNEYVKRLPENTGVFLKKGTNIYLEGHYESTGKQEEADIQVAVYFYKQKPSRELKATILSNSKFRIPADVSHYPVQSKSRLIHKDIQLLGLWPHMHYRGKSAKFIATYPDGKQETLLSVPRYDYNYQRIYLLEQQKSIPAGTRISFSGVFDNSKLNPFNPNPKEDVSWSYYSSGEMFWGAMLYVEK